MAQDLVYTEANTVEVAKQTAARLGRVVVIAPSMAAITEGAVFDGDFDIKNTAGLPPPDNAPGVATGAAGVLTGAYAYYITHYDSDRDSESNPSAQSATVNPSSQQVDVDLTTITNEAANSRVTHFRIYRNLNGGSVYYFVAQVTVATASYSDNSSDATIQANDTLLLDNDAPAAETYGSVYAHKGYLFLYGSHTTTSTEYEDDFTWSKVNSPDNFPLLNRTKVEPGRYGTLKAIASSGDGLIFYKERAIYELHFNQDPSGIFGDGFAKTVNTHRGTVNKRTVANVQGQHFVMDRLGIYHFTGGTAYRELATKLSSYWRRINWDRREWFSAAVDLDRVYFWVALDNETECRWAFVLDLNAWYANGQVNWYIYHTNHGIRDCVAFILGSSDAAVDNGMSHNPVVAVVTEYGYTGYMAAGYRDFMDPQLTATGTATGGTSTTLVDSGATWQRTNDAGSTVNPVGAYLRFIHPNSDKVGSADWDGPYRITAYSGTGPTLTFTPAAPASVASGMAYQIGYIPRAELHSPQYGFESPHKAKRAARIAVEFQPGGTEYTVNMKISTDRRAPHLTSITRDTAQHDSTSGLQGVDMKLGGTLQDGGRIGVHAQPAGGRDFRYLQIIFDATGVDKPAVIDAVLIDTVQEVVSEVP